MDPRRWHPLCVRSYPGKLLSARRGRLSRCQELEDHLSEEKAERVLETGINWGRHAEIFAHDHDTEVLNLENF